MRRSFAISKPPRTLVFTDLDGSLLDHDSYAWSAAAPALAELRRRRIPLIFCTSKTAAEVRALRKDMNNPHPFIAENGAAIVIPARYFPSVPALSGNSTPLTLVLGRTYPQLVCDLNALAREAQVEIRAFHQMSGREIARATGLSHPQANRARQRLASEPFLFLRSRPAAIQRFCRRAQQKGYSVQRGGRFWHFSDGSDKGLALSLLVGFYGVAWRALIHTIALGDSANDSPMLRLVDRPILIPRPDGTYAQEVLARMPGITRAPSPGPAGWSTAVLRALDSSPPAAPSPNGRRPRRRSPS
jgi:mannosyl-3-phosphoglycerate phosphatase